MEQAVATVEGEHPMTSRQNNCRDVSAGGFVNTRQEP
jgi:hypothetical protein